MDGDLTRVAIALAMSLLAAVPSARVELSREDQLLATVRVEVADDPVEQSQGLMGRTELPEDAGMLFVFASPGEYCFWMRDTPLPLSIAFARADGRVVEIEDMQPYDESLHCPPEPILTALEVPQGYLARRGVQVGDTLTRPQLRLPLTLGHASDRD